MTHRYSLAEARIGLPTILDQVEAGIEVQITRRGKPVAVVVAPGVLERLRTEQSQFRGNYREFLRSHSLLDIGIDEKTFADARQRGDGRKVSI